MREFMIFQLQTLINYIKDFFAPGVNTPMPDLFFFNPCLFQDFFD